MTAFHSFIILTHTPSIVSLRPYIFGFPCQLREQSDAVFIWA